MLESIKHYANIIGEISNAKGYALIIDTGLMYCQNFRNNFLHTSNHEFVHACVSNLIGTQKRQKLSKRKVLRFSRIFNE